MPIRLICVCGRGMSLPEKYAGQHVQCPDCRAMLHIPSPEENLVLARWYCSCGLRLKARPRAGGRKLRCPRCSAEVAVPFLNGHAAFIEERFLLDDASGIVQKVAEEPRQSPGSSSQVSPPPEEPSVKETLATSSQLPAAAQPPAGPASFLEEDEDDTTIRPRDARFLGESRRAAAKPAGAGAYEVEPQAAAAPAARRRPGEPLPPAAGTPQPPVSPDAEDEEFWAQDEGDEGIRAAALARYFNTTTGVEAAKAGALQVWNGYWLYIPYALLIACMANITQLILRGTEGKLSAAIAGLFLPAVFGLFLSAGFVACVKDGVFERAMGIERMFYNAGVHFLRFTGAALLVVPIGVGLAFAGVAAISSVWGLSPLIIKIGIVALAIAGGLFALELLLMAPLIAVLEHQGPFTALGRGLSFSFRHVWDLITLTVVSMFVGGGIVGAVYLIWWLSRLLFYFIVPPWLFDSLGRFFGGLAAAAIMGQIVASLTLLRLSHIGDEDRLQAIRSRLRGPRAAPLRLYAAIGAAGVALLVLSYYRVGPTHAAALEPQEQLLETPDAREPQTLP